MDRSNQTALPLLLKRAFHKKMTLEDPGYQQIEEILCQSLLHNKCIRIVLSKKSSKSDSAHPASKISYRPIKLKGELCFQKTSQVKKQEMHENFSTDAIAKDVLQIFRNDFLNCHLFTTDADYEFRFKKKKGTVIKKSRPTLKLAVESHNKTKQYIIPEHVPCPFLVEVGIMNDRGEVRKSRYSKFRQINRYLELVSDTVSFLPENGTLRVIDFGCGKSYLTFALHYYLKEILNRDVRIIGLDWNEDVIRECQKICQKLQITEMEFQTGDIGHYQNSDPVHLAVSLHACDTATDLALAQAISWKTDIILAVPCCQHELFSQISNGSQSALLQHGILRERYSAMATDSLRACLMEICGYQTQVLEFIDMEHTAKNVLIRSIQKSEENQPQSLDLKQAEMKKYLAFKAELGIESFAMEKELIKLGQLNSLPD